MTGTTMVMDRPPTTASILERSLCLVLHRHYLGNNRQVQTDAVVAAAEGIAGKVDGMQIRSTKKLVDNAVLRPAMRILNDVQEGLRKLAIPAHRVFGERTYLIPFEHLDEADAFLEAAVTDLAVQSALIAESYEAAKEKQREILGPLFDAKEYPTKEEVRLAYSIEWNYIEFKAPERLESVNRAVFEKARDRTDRQMDEMWVEVRRSMREMLRQTVAEMAKKIEPGTDGSRKFFKNTVLEDLQEFLSTFSVKNLSNDDELAEIVEQLKGMATGLTPDRLRDSDRLREDVLAQAKEATDKLDALVVPFRRAIRLPGEGR